MIETSTSYYSGKSDQEIAAQAQAKFGDILKDFGVSVGISGSTMKVDSDFESESSKHIRCVVGTNLSCFPKGTEFW